MSRIVLGIEFDGSRFVGWQYQKNGRSVQDELQKVLSKIAVHPITLHCAGRTDSGVHGLEQVVHFDTTAERKLDSWMLGSNSKLPEDVRVIWVKNAVDDFHARYSAVARLYRYVILNRKMKSALIPRQATWCYSDLDAEKMHLAAQSLVGEHDFSSFRAQGCQSLSPNRIMHFINVYRQQDQVIIELSANAFLHHMVRNMAGVLMDIGTGKHAINWTEELLELKDRKKAGVTAPPYGLYLAGVYYPEKYGIDKHPAFNQLAADARRFEH